MEIKIKCFLFVVISLMMVATLAAPAFPSQVGGQTGSRAMLGGQQGQMALTKVTHRPTEKEMANLEDRIGYKFKKSSLLLDALTHSSFSEANNDALNILGSKVVQQAIALHFMLENSYITKGELDRHIANFSSVKICAVEALDLGLEPLIMVSKAVQMPNQKVLSAAFNAIFGAISLDDGPTTANFAYWTVKNWNKLEASVETS